MAGTLAASTLWSADTLDDHHSAMKPAHPKEVAEMRRKKLRAKQAKKTVEQLEDDAKQTLPKSLHELGNECYELGEFQNAIIYYSRAIAVDPSDARLYSNRSACFTVLQMYGRALNDAQTSIALKPRWKKGYFRAGAALFHLNQYAEALDMFETAAALDPYDRALQGACYDCRQRLKLFPVGFVEETGKEYLRPPTPLLRDTYGSGALFAWGGGELGCLGHGETDTHVYPKCVDGLRGRQVVDVACGFAHTVAVTAKGETWVWGDNTEYQCGMGFGHPMLNERITMPARVPGLIGRRAVAVSCGTAHSVVITADGEVFSWGAGSDGQLGLGDRQPRMQPTRVEYFTPKHRQEIGPGPLAISVACGAAHTFVLAAGGICHAFGRNDHGQLGLQSHTKREFAKRFLSPRRVFVGRMQPVDTPRSSVFSGRSGPLSPTSVGGGNRSRLRSHSSESEEIPQQFVHAVITQVACGHDHTVMISSNGEAYAAGSNEFGQLGIGEECSPVTGDGELKSPSNADASSPSKSSPVKPGHPGIVAFRMVKISGIRMVMAACGRQFTLLLSELRDVFSFGRGDSGQLGTGQLEHSFSPVLVKGMQLRFTEFITCRSDQAVCVCRNGEVYWWGSGLRYRPDGVLLEGVRKEVLDARLAFSNTLPAEPPAYMVSSENKAAPRFKQRVADYYKQRGVFSQTVLDALGIARSQDSLKGMTMVSPSRRKRKGKSGALAVNPTESQTTTDDMEEREGGASSESKSTRNSNAPSIGQLMDMAMSIASLEPVRTTLPKDTKVMRVMCGEDFYVAITEGSCAALCRITEWHAYDEEDVKQLEVMKRYQDVRQMFEKQYGSGLAETVLKGRKAERKEGDYIRQRNERLASQEQDEEVRAMMEQQLGRKLVEDYDGNLGWKSVIQAISQSLVFNKDGMSHHSRRSSRVRSVAQLPPVPKPAAFGQRRNSKSSKPPTAATFVSSVGTTGKEQQILFMNAGEILVIKLQTFDCRNVRRKRGDDQWFVYAVHCTEDCVVLFDVDDNFDGSYRLCARLRKSGQYRLHVTLRQDHALGSPFDLFVEPGAPWAPTSEYFPLATDGLRADVRLELREYVVERVSGWGVPHIGHSSRAVPLYKATQEEQPMQDVYRMPVSVVIPYPDLRKALEYLQSTEFQSTLFPTRKQRGFFTKPPAALYPDGTRMDAKPVFMYFGKQFHCTQNAVLGEPLRIAVVLKDKYGNEVKDHGWYGRVRADIHKLCGETAYGLHTTTIRMKFNEAETVVGQVDAVLERVRTDYVGNLEDWRLSQALLPLATSVFDTKSIVEHPDPGDECASEATAGSGRDVRALLRATLEEETLSPRASLMPTHGVPTQDSVELAGVFSTLSVGGLDSVEPSTVVGPSMILDAPPAIVLDNPFHEDFGLDSDVLSTVDVPNMSVVPAAGFDPGTSAQQSPDAGLESTAELDYDGGPSESVVSASEAFAKSESLDVTLFPGWSVDTSSVVAIKEQFLICGNFGAVGDHSVSLTVSSTPVPDPWDGSSFYIKDDFIAEPSVRGFDLSLESAHEFRTTVAMSQSSILNTKLPQLEELTPRQRSASRASIRSKQSLSQTSLKKSTDSTVQRVPKLGLRDEGKSSGLGSVRTRSTGPPHANASSRSLDKYRKATTPEEIERAEYITKETRSLRQEFRRRLQGLSRSHASVISSTDTAARRLSRSSEPSVASGIGDVEQCTTQPPLICNSVNKKADLYQPSPDDYIGLPALYKVVAGPARASKSVVHYLDPLLLELPRVTTKLAPDMAEFHRLHIARDFGGDVKPQAPLPDPITVPFHVPVGFFTVIGVTLADEWGNPTSLEVHLDAKLKGPVELTCVVNSIDVEDKLLRAPVAQMIPRYTLANIRNEGRAENRKMATTANVDSPVWSIGFYSFTTGTFQLHVTQDGDDCVGSPVTVEVIPSLIHVPSCFVRGDGLSLGRFEPVPEPALREEPSLPPTLDYPVWLAPDRPEITVVGCDEWGNQVQSGGATIVAKLFRYLDRPPSRASSASSGEKSADFGEMLTQEEIRSQLDSVKCDEVSEEKKMADDVRSDSDDHALQDHSDSKMESDEGLVVESESGCGWYEVGRMANIKVSDNSDGTYHIAYTIRHAGRHKLEIDINGIRMSQMPVCFCVLEFSPPPYLPPVQYDSDEDREFMANLIQSPASVTKSRRLKQKTSMRDVVTNMLSSKEAAEKVKTGMAEAAAKIAERNAERVKAEEFRQALHEKNHWSEVAKTILEHRNWTLGLESERKQAFEQWQQDLEILRRPLRDPYEAVIRRMTKQRAVDDKRRKQLRETERAQAFEAEQARVLFAREEYRQRLLTFFLEEERRNMRNPVDAERDRNWDDGNGRLTFLRSNPFVRPVGGGALASFYETSDESAVLKPEARAAAPQVQQADQDLDNTVRRMGTTLKLEPRRQERRSDVREMLSGGISRHGSVLGGSKAKRDDLADPDAVE